MDAPSTSTSTSVSFKKKKRPQAATRTIVELDSSLQGSPAESAEGEEDTVRSVTGPLFHRSPSVDSS